MGNGASNLGEWLKAKCDGDRLSLRQVAKKAGLSHQTIAGLMDGKRALPQTIKRLAKAFSDDHHQTIALEDKLLCLAGYRTERPEEELSEPVARLLDKLGQFNQSQLMIMEQFADFISKTERI